MTEKMWIRSHVEMLLQGDWEACRVHRDADDIPFRNGTAACWVSVLDSEPIMVRVFAHAALGIKPTAAALREINQLQAQCLSTQIALVQGIVMVSQTISPVGLSQDVLAQAVAAVSCMAADVGPLFAAMFGGQTPYPADSTADEGVS